MKNKTIFDAVNELHGEVLGSVVKDIIIRPSTGELRVWYGFDLDGLNTPTWSHLCSIEEFNALVEEMKNNFGKCLDYQYIAYQLAAKQLLEPTKPEPNTYTQEMFDNGVLPSAGMECLFKNSGRMDFGTVTVRTKQHIIFTLKDGHEEVRDVNYCTCKPLTQPTPLTDGKAYQFDSITSDAVSAIYFSVDNRFYVGEEYYNTQNCTNIQPLTLAGE